MLRLKSHTFYSDPAFAGGGCEIETPLLLAGALQRTGEECLPRTAGSAPRTGLCRAMAITLPEKSKHQCPRTPTPSLAAHHCSLTVAEDLLRDGSQQSLPFSQGVPQPRVPGHPHRWQTVTPLPPHGSQHQDAQGGLLHHPKTPI